MCQGTEGRAVSSSWAERVTERRSRGEARSADLSGRKLLRGGGARCKERAHAQDMGEPEGRAPVTVREGRRGEQG